MIELLQQARSDDCNVNVAGIHMETKASIELHESIGFEYYDKVQHPDYKSDPWLELGFHRLVLDTALPPVKADSDKLELSI